MEDKSILWWIIIWNMLLQFNAWQILLFLYLYSAAFKCFFFLLKGVRIFPQEQKDNIRPQDMYGILDIQPTWLFFPFYSTAQESIVRA